MPEKKTIKDKLSPELAKLFPLLCDKDSSSSWQKAWEEFYRLTYDPMMSMAIRSVGDRNLAEELVQEAYTSISQRLLEGGEPIVNLYDYAFVTLKHQIIDDWRKWAKRMEIAQTEGIDMEKADHFRARSGANRFEEQVGFVIGLMKALDALRDNERELLVMFYLQEMSTQEVFDNLYPRYPTLNSVDQAKHRANLALRGKMKEQGFTGKDTIGITW